MNLHRLHIHRSCSPRICDVSARKANQAEYDLRAQDERDRMAYADVTDELNDPCNHEMSDATDENFCSVCTLLSDLDGVIVDWAQRYAADHSLPWPPGPGDYDRFYEMQRRHR